MALFGSFNNLVNAGLSVLGQQGGLLGNIGNIGSAVIRASTPAPQALTIAAGPVMGAGMASAPVIARAGATLASAGRTLSASAQRALISIAETMGLRSMTLRRAIRIYQKIRKFVIDPFLIASIMGITVEQLGELLLEDSKRPRRRMNPANSKALNRAARRIESFHRLCMRTDKLRAPRRRSSSRKQTIVKCN